MRRKKGVEKSWNSRTGSQPRAVPVEGGTQQTSRGHGRPPTRGPRPGSQAGGAVWRFTVLRGWRLLKVAQPRLVRSCRAGRTHRLRAAAAPSPAWAGRPEEAPTRRALRRPPARSLASLSTCLQGMVFHAAMFSFARHENPQAAARSWSLTQAACRGQNGCSRGRATCTHSESGRVCPLASQPGPGDRAPALVAPRLDRRPQSRHTTQSRGEQRRCRPQVRSQGSA